ncbi:MAG: hypothetical protein ACFFD4_38475, partial [Candidatus Odinarchaeota archaeon]
FDSISGLPLFSKVDDQKIDSTLFSGFMAAARNFFSQLSLGGLSSFTTENKNVFIAAKTRIITAVVTSEQTNYRTGYSIAYEISEMFENTYEIPQANLRMDQSQYQNFSQKLDKFLNNYHLLRQIGEDTGIDYEDQTPVQSELLAKIIYLYTMNRQGELVSIVSQEKDDLLSYPLLIIVNTIIKRIYILENDEDIPNRLLFLASDAATKINNQRWKNEFLIRDVSDPLDCERLIDQVCTLMKECDSKL